MLSALLLFVTATLAGVYFWLVQQLGTASVHAVIRLIVRGCVSWEHISRKPLTVTGVTVKDTKGLTVFEADKVILNTATWSLLHVKLLRPRINLLADSDGLLHIVALLQDVGYLREVKATPTVTLSPQSTDEAIEVRKKPGKARVVSTSQKHTAQFSGRAQIYIANLTFEDGCLDLPAEAGQIVGRHAKFEAVAGTSNVARFDSKDSRWFEVETPHQEYYERASMSQEGWWNHKSPPSTTSERVRFPFVMLFQSENVLTHARGWRTEEGFLLHKPVSSSVNFTQDIARFVLSQMHPLLGYAAGLEEGNQIQCSITPADMHLPCQMLSIRLEPLKVRLKTKALIKGLINMLRLLGKKEWDEPDLLEAWTSAIAADVYRTGTVVSKRMDILLGHDVQHGDGLHMLMWGTVDTSNETSVKMVLGLPQKTLAWLGARDLDEDLIYYLDVRGTAYAPEVDWIKAGKDLAEMVLKSKMQKGFPILKSIFRNPSEKRKSKQFVDLPEPTLPLPWEAFPEEGTTEVLDGLDANSVHTNSEAAESILSQSPSQLTDLDRDSVQSSSAAKPKFPQPPQWQRQDTSQAPPQDTSSNSTAQTSAQTSAHTSKRRRSIGVENVSLFT